MKDFPRLPDAELEVMQIIWAKEGGVSRQDIEKALSSRRSLAPTTVLTFLTRRVEKGFLKVEKAGRSNLYSPLISRRDYLARESRSILDKLFGGSLSSFALSLSDAGLSRAELEELRELLERDEL